MKKKMYIFKQFGFDSPSEFSLLAFTEDIAKSDPEFEVLEDGTWLGDPDAEFMEEVEFEIYGNDMIFHDGCPGYYARDSKGQKWFCPAYEDAHVWRLVRQ